jgi:hypothetical protein
MPWQLTVSVCLIAGGVFGFFLADCLATLTIEDANRRALAAEVEIERQKDLVDKWKRVAHPNVTNQVADIEAGRILREQRQQQGGFRY